MGVFRIWCAKATVRRSGSSRSPAASTARAARRAAEPNCFTTGAFQQTVRSMTEKD
jgi:hypothetical protein